MSSFQDLEVWRRSKDLAVRVVQAVDTSRHFSLREQMARSAISVPSNIAEGAERHGKREFRNFVSYASGSCAELATQLMIAREIGDLEPPLAEALGKECREIGRMLYALAKSLE